MNIIKKIKKRFIVLFIVGIAIVAYLFLNKPLYFGYVQLDDKQVDNGNYIITFHKQEDNQKIEGNLDNVSIYKNEEKISLESAWDNIEVGNTYQVTMERDKFPYNMFNNNNIKSFYMD